MLANAAIATCAASYCYEGDVWALRNVDFHAGRGEFVTLLASNGSGKTTLIKLLVGLLKPQKGGVFVEGSPMDSYSPRQLFEKIGLVFQNPNDQLFSSTVEEDIAFGPRNLGLSEIEVLKRVDIALQTMGATHLRKRAIHHLSFGEQKRVAIAGILALRPSILILDEPTAGLDPAGETMMMKLLGRLNREHGLTIILATHAVDLLPLFTDRVYLLNKGSVVKVGSPLEVFQDQNLIEKTGLRLPYVASLMQELKTQDGVPIEGMPLTIGEARNQLLEFIPRDLRVSLAV